MTVSYRPERVAGKCIKGKDAVSSCTTSQQYLIEWVQTSALFSVDTYISMIEPSAVRETMLLRKLP